MNNIGVILRPLLFDQGSASMLVSLISQTETPPLHVTTKALLLLYFSTYITQSKNVQALFLKFNDLKKGLLITTYFNAIQILK